jgi:cytochrome c oxidase subunit 3
MSLANLERTGVGGAPLGEQWGEQRLSHQFEDIDQQNECYIVGMWSFLVTEVMFFGALFLAYSLYRVLYFNTYMEAHQFLDIRWGTLNTFVLLASSLSMALAVDAHQHGQRKAMIGLLSFTVLCAFGFMAIKTVEYTNKINEGLFPGGNKFDYARALHLHHKEAEERANEPFAFLNEHELPDRYKLATRALEEMDHEQSVRFVGAPREGFDTRLTTVTPSEGNGPALAVPSEAANTFEREANKARLFFSIYFAMTGLHGIHVIVGIVLIGAIIVLALMKHRAVDDYMPTEMVGLYWHFVDVVWIFLFPLMYLIS